MGYTEFFMQHFLWPITFIFGEMSFHAVMITDKEESHWACDSSSWCQNMFPLPRPTHSKTALDGLSLFCSAQHLMPAVVRSSLQVWPQGLCLCKYRYLWPSFLVFTAPPQHCLFFQEHHY
jgi:hypothetical protein